MADIYHQIGVKAELDNVYASLTTLEGLSSWWTETTGSTGINEILHFHFGDQVIEMTITSLAPGKHAQWLCTEKEGEWKDTMISFDLEQADEQVFINFAHRNWNEQTMLCAHCSTKWAIFLMSLKDYLEKGRGQPFPYDVHVNHSDI